MKKIHLAIIAVVAVAIYFVPRNSTETTKIVKIPKERRVEAMAAQEFEMTKDPKTNEVPNQHLSQLKKELMNLPVKENASLFSWEERGPDNFGGRCRTIHFDHSDPSGNTIWAGGVAGGLWKCTNAKSQNYSWEEITSFTGTVAISAIVQDPNAPEVFYVGTGEGWFNGDAYRGNGIYKSTDSGASWDVLPGTNTNDFRYIMDMIIADNGNVIACTRDDGVRWSNNGGQNWFKSLGNGAQASSDRATDLDMADDGVIYVAMGLGTSEDGIYRSDNDGANWTYKPFPFTNYRRIALAVSPSNSDRVYAIVEDNDSDTRGEAKYIVRSSDGGDTWDTFDPPSAFGMDVFTRTQSWYDLSIAVDPSDEDRLFIGGVDLLVSSNAGESFSQISQWYGGGGFQYVHADQHTIRFADDTGENIIFSNDGGLWYTQNGKDPVPNIEERNSGFNITQFYACAVHPDAGADWFLGGTQDNGSHLYTSDGINSTIEVTGGDGAYCHIDQDNPDIQITSYVYNNYFVTNNSWGSRQSFNDGDSEGYFINPTDYDSQNDLLFCSAEAGFVKVFNVSTGDFNDELVSSMSASERITAVKVSPFDATKIFLGTNSGDLHLYDHFTKNSIELYNGSGNLRNVDIDLFNEDRMVMSYSNFGVTSVFYSDNKGVSWNNIEGNLPDIPVRWAVFNPCDPDAIILATELGVWSTSAIAGTSTLWELNSANLPLTRIDMIEVRSSDNMLVAASHGRGMYTHKFDNGEPMDNCLTSIGLEINNSCVPQVFDNTGMTASGISPALSCGDAGSGQDTWFNFVVPNAISLVVETTQVTGGLTDMVMQAYAGNCNNLTLLACDDNSGTDNHALLDLSGLQAGTRVYLRVIEQGADEEGMFGICILAEGNPGDICDTSVSLDVNATCQVASFDNSGAMPSGAVPVIECGNAGAAQDLWFNFEVPDPSPNVIIVETRAVPGGLDDMVMQAYSGDCNSLTVIECDDDGGDGTHSRIDLNGLVPGAVIYIRVVDYNSNDEGPFGICVHGNNLVDADNDGYFDDVDCDDNDPNINPGAAEICDDIDNNCNGETDEGLAVDTYYRDADGDSFGDPLIIMESCKALDGYVLNDDDCDDTNALINPSGIEILDNGIDEDCDGFDTSGTHELAGEIVKIYPNPARDFIMIETSKTKDLLVELFAMNGQLIVSQKDLRIELDGIPGGMYLVKLTDLNAGKSVVDRVLVDR